MTEIVVKIYVVRNKTGDHQIHGSGLDLELQMAAPKHFSPKKQLKKEAATDPCQELSSAIHSKHWDCSMWGLMRFPVKSGELCHLRAEGQPATLHTDDHILQTSQRILCFEGAQAQV